MMGLLVLVSHTVLVNSMGLSPQGSFLFLASGNPTRSGPPPEMASFMSFWGTNQSLFLHCLFVYHSFQCWPSQLSSFQLIFCILGRISVGESVFFSKRKKKVSLHTSSMLTLYTLAGSIQAICSSFLYIPHLITTPFKTSPTTHSLFCSVCWQFCYCLFKSIFIVLTAIVTLALSIFCWLI